MSSWRDKVTEALTAGGMRVISPCVIPEPGVTSCVLRPAGIDEDGRPQVDITVTRAVIAAPGLDPYDGLEAAAGQVWELLAGMAIYVTATGPHHMSSAGPFAGPAGRHAPMIAVMMIRATSPARQYRPAL